jgi:hypothetical protein
MAQLFHVDMSHIKFVHFFIYLVDVDESTGPFTYLRGSHHRKVPATSRDGRLRDEEVLAHYPREAIFPVTGPRGTIFACDNRALHKGTTPISRCRLVLQVMYAIDHFFVGYRKLSTDRPFEPWFLERIRRYPFTFSRFLEDR